MTAAPSGAFRCADGPINIAANKQEQFEKLCELIGRPDLAIDPRFAERETRKANRAAINAELEQALAAKSAQEWEGLLNAHGIPAGRILTVPKSLPILKSPHAIFCRIYRCLMSTSVESGWCVPVSTLPTASLPHVARHGWGNTMPTLRQSWARRCCSGPA
jgi:crotonobetainyl-CoA:carnitine CoA-transferase CaiB-like acyl-CoA transferase